ncbi:MLO-like protein 6 [Vitis vinifera]|uniref:MLO-like protein n=2 Tax=Vitis vinifera TaxID=29760 RepID=A0A438FD44_VITVI|nr:MLO-like protein 6 [Vitis vinifera]
MADKLEDRSLTETPTWAVAVVCFVLLAVSIFIEHIIHHIGSWLKRRNKRALYEALERSKQICISKSVGSTWYPCDVDEKKFKNTCGTESGKVPFVSYYGIHQLHIFIFVLALSCDLLRATLALGTYKMRRWKTWEDELGQLNINTLMVCKGNILWAQAFEFLSSSPVLLWIVCFFRQFYGSVHRDDYLALRHGFIVAHLPPESERKFDFRKYIHRSLEEDFKAVVGIRSLILPPWGICPLSFVQPSNMVLCNIVPTHQHTWVVFLLLASIHPLIVHWGGSSCKRHSSGQMVHFLALEIQLRVKSLTGDVQRLLQLDFTLILSLMQLAMVHASHEHLPFKVIFNLGLPFTNSQEITNGCLLRVQSLPSVGNSRKSYLEVTYQRLARGKLVHFHGWKSLALPSVGLAKTTELCILALGTFPGNLSSKELEAPERSILGFRQQKSNGKYLPMSVASFGRLQEPFRRRKVVPAKFRRHPRGLRNYFARPSYLHQAAKLASILKFPAPFSRHGSCIVRRRNTLLYKSVAKFSQQKVDSAALQSDWLVMAATSSFQLQIAHRLKHWIVDFLSFEMVYSLHHLDFRKCSKSGCYDCHQEYAPWQILFAFSPCNPDSLLAIEF